MDRSTIWYFCFFLYFKFCEDYWLKDVDVGLFWGLKMISCEVWFMILYQFIWCSWAIDAACKWIVCCVVQCWTTWIGTHEMGTTKFYVYASLVHFSIYCTRLLVLVSCYFILLNPGLLFTSNECVVCTLLRMWCKKSIMLC